jgi:hypothetical protein
MRLPPVGASHQRSCAFAELGNADAEWLCDAEADLGDIEMIRELLRYISLRVLHIHGALVAVSHCSSAATRAALQWAGCRGLAHEDAWRQVSVGGCHAVAQRSWGSR